MNNKVNFVYGTQAQYDRLQDEYMWGAFNGPTVYHFVKDGDSWESIAGMYSIPVAVLRSRNTPIDTLSAGIKILIK